MRSKTLLIVAFLGIVSCGLSHADDRLVKIDNGLLSVTYDKGLETFKISHGDTCFADGERFNAGSDITVKVIELDDALGKGQAIEESDVSGLKAVLALYDDLPFVCFRADFNNVYDQPMGINELEPVALRLNLAASPEELNVLGCDGLAPATEAKKSYTFLTVAHPKTRKGVVCGWLTQRRGSGLVAAEVEEGKIRLVGETGYGGKLNVAPGTTATGEILALGYFDNAHEGLEAYGDAIAKANDIHLPKVPSGYCTWYHAGASNQRNMKRLAEFCQENLRDYGFDVLQIDDKWQLGNRDYTTHKPDGPYKDGMKSTADTIMQNGFTAGLWFIPFGWDRNAPSLAAHPDWFVHKKDGSIYDVKWAGDCLDMTHPEARAFLKEVIDRMTHEWGYKYLKIDGLWSGMAVKILYPDPTYRDDAMGDAVFHDKTKTNVDAYRDGLKLVREAAGDDVFLLGCNIAQNMRTLGASIGLVDGMRVGRDIGANWEAILPCARIGAHLYFLHGKVWYNDPDCLMLRNPLTLDQARAWGSWIGISGQMNLVSESLERLPAEKLDIIKRTMPNHNRLGRPVDLFENNFPSTWHLHVDQAGIQWEVVTLFNWDAEKESEVALDLETLGIPASGKDQYVGFDYWENTFVAPFSKSYTATLRPSSCRVIALHRVADRPQLVSTSRHVTQGAVDLTAVAWDEAPKVLSGTSRVVAGDPYELRIIIPASYQLAAATVSRADVKIEVTATGPQARVVITSPETRDVSWKLAF